MRSLSLFLSLPLSVSCFLSHTLTSLIVFHRLLTSWPQFSILLGQLHYKQDCISAERTALPEMAQIFIMCMQAGYVCICIRVCMLAVRVES